MRRRSAAPSSGRPAQTRGDGGTAPVRGDFPSQSENAIIALSLVEEALRRWEDTPEDGRLVLGVDVARFGDDETVIFPVRG